MTRHERDAVGLIRSLVEPHGCTVTTEMGGKHLGVVIEAPNGRWAKFPVSGSPRSASCQLNHIRQQITGWLESVDLVDRRGVHGPSRKQKRQTRVRSRVWRVEVMEDPHTGPARDPWAALSGFRLNSPGQAS